MNAICTLFDKPFILDNYYAGNHFISDDIIILRNPQSSHCIYNFKNIFHKAESIVATVNEFCSICGRHLRYSTNTILYNLRYIHSKCAEMVKNIIMGKSLATITLNCDFTKDIKSSLTMLVYNVYNGTLFSCDGIFLKSWALTLMLPRWKNKNNIYEQISYINFTINTFHVGNCLYCNATINGDGYKNNVLNKNYCAQCALPMIKFKNNLIEKYDILKHVVCQDVVRFIICTIIDIYALIN